MGISGARRAGSRLGGKRGLGRTVGVVASVALALAVAAPAWATVSATATLAPVGSASYLVTVTNTGSEAITGFSVYPTGFTVTNIVPSPACQYQGSAVIRWITCSLTVAPAASTEMCYTGYARGGSVPGTLWGGVEGGYTNMSPSPAGADAHWRASPRGPATPRKPASRPCQAARPDRAAQAARLDRAVPPSREQRCPLLVARSVQEHVQGVDQDASPRDSRAEEIPGKQSPYGRMAVLWPS